MLCVLYVITLFNADIKKNFWMYANTKFFVKSST